MSMNDTFYEVTQLVSNNTTQAIADTGNTPRSTENISEFTVGSMAELKERAPEVYDLTLKTIAQQIIREAEKYNRRFKAAQAKMRG